MLSRPLANAAQPRFRKGRARSKSMCSRTLRSRFEVEVSVRSREGVCICFRAHDRGATVATRSLSLICNILLRVSFARFSAPLALPDVAVCLSRHLDCPVRRWHIPLTLWGYRTERSRAEEAPPAKKESSIRRGFCGGLSGADWNQRERYARRGASPNVEPRGDGVRKDNRDHAIIA